MTPRITLETFGEAAWQQMVALRQDVLRAPLGLRFDADQLAAEAGQLHLALWLDERLTGTLLLVPPDAAGEGRIRQMAIRSGHRGHGLGGMLVRRGEDEFRRLHGRCVQLAARESAVGFYARLGYVAEGDSFVEVTLPHRMMCKWLEGQGSALDPLKAQP